MKKAFLIAALLAPVFIYSQAFFTTTNFLEYNAVEGVTTASQSYRISGNSLSPSAGNITATATQYVEISIDNVNFSSSPIVIPYTGGQFPLKTIYVRVSGAAVVPGTILNGGITHSGGSAPNNIVAVTAYYPKTYYNTKANLGLQNTGTWSRTEDGTGASPAFFSDPYATFKIINQTNANYSGAWNVPDINSRVIIGSVASPVTFTILHGADYIGSNTRITVENNSTLILKNNVLPKIYSIGTNTVVDYAQEGTGTSDTIIIYPTTYWNLKLTGGIKYFQGGYTVNNNFTADGVASIGAFPTSVSPVTLLCRGNMTFLNGTHFDSSAAEDNHRISILKFSSLIPGQPQQVNTNGTDLVLQQVRIEGTGPVIFSPNTNILLSSTYSSGIVFTQAASSMVTEGGLITFKKVNSLFNINIFGNQVGKLSSTGTSFKFICSPLVSGQSIPPGCIGRLIFTPGSTIGDLTMNTDSEIDSIQVLSDVKIMGALNMIKGKIALAQGVKLELGETATTPQPGSINSFIHGEVISTGTNARTIPIGNYISNRFFPVDFTNHTPGNSYSFTYFFNNYPDHTIAPGTLASFPDYNVSWQEYWKITSANPGNADINFHYYDSYSGILNPAVLRVAVYNDGAGWTDLGGTPSPGNTITSGTVQVTNVSSFGPFTFAGSIPGIIPVKLISFSVKKQNSTAQLLWSTAQETNSRSFIVQRSADQVLWSDLITVPAAGNSNVKKDYTTTDYNPFSGFNYYRLKIIDDDNRFNFSATKIINFSNAETILLYPNPSKDVLSVYIPNIGSPVEINIYDATGKLVLSSVAQDIVTRINVSRFPKGIYILKVTGKNIADQKRFSVN